MKKKPVEKPPLTELEIAKKNLGAVMASQMILTQLVSDDVVGSVDIVRCSVDFLRLKIILQNWELGLIEKFKKIDPEFKPFDWRTL
jgi:hypothetical protein